jgi:hyperosmotically inducible protein
MYANSSHGYLHALIIAGAASALCVLGTTARADNTPTPHSDSAAAAISDTGITAKVKASYLGDERLKGTHIKVVTTNGVVTLTGTAPNSDSKSTAEDLARNVNGVKSVDNQLSTGPNTGIQRKVAESERVGSDSWITTKVKSEILTDNVGKGFDVHVRTKNGVVMLSGKLKDHDAIDHVKDLAEKVDGVKSVDTTRLRVSAD